MIFKQIETIDQRATAKKARISRLIKRLSLTEVAKTMNISKAYLSDLERGKRLWTKEKWNNFVKALK